tara:strand:- start:33 stop:209 length:177 start_codon:yes stop_codon:yes gene_type:complete
MNEDKREILSELSSMRIEIRKANEKMEDLLQVLSDMRRKYASQLGISDNEFIDLERVR